MTTLRAGAATDVGRVRANNQDQLLVAEPLFAVADGMGGHAAGEVASQTALDALHEAFATYPRATPESLSDAAHAANRAVWDASEASAERRGMGTTLTAVALVSVERGSKLAVVNVGDSRTYRLRVGELEQLTVDHSLVAELVAQGRIRSEEAETHPQRHVLTRALGVYPEVDVDLLTFDPVVGDRYLLCSDGLSREVSDNLVASILRRLADPGEAARELVAEARAHGGNDNITVVVVDVVGNGAAPTSSADQPTMAAPALFATDPDANPERGDRDANGPEPGGVPHPVDTDNAAAPDTAAPEARRVEPDEVKGRQARKAPREQRRAAKAAKEPVARIITLRVVGFFVLILAIIGAALGGTAWYARDSYFVSLHDKRITIFKGRPGGVLWWQPTIFERTSLRSADVETHNLPALRSGVQETSLSSARQYVHNLRAEEQAAQPSPTTTVSPTTTTPAATTTPATTGRTTTTARSSAGTAGPLPGRTRTA